MCGIAGYWGEGNEKILDKMIDSVSYRGPDDRGTLVRNNIGLGHRRLSIIDLSAAGHQPMSNESDTVHLVFNGEIYNYKDLKNELKEKHNFKGNSDTEVIIYLYEEYGEEVFSKLAGMFTIALLDEKKNKLYLARDRMGKKPLYWYKYEGLFLFGSELKVLMNHPNFKREIDINSLNKYLSYEYIPTPHSIFKNTYKLEPGSYLTYDGINIDKKNFWQPTFLPKETSLDNAKTELNHSLLRSIEKRLISDVPIGVFLSGGIDSSTVAYYATRVSKSKVKTFSIGFKEKSFDESEYAKEVANYLGTEHYEKILSVKDGLEIIKEIGNNLDEPIADASIIPTFLLSKFTREHVTVALGGDGGDELFFGYDTFLAHKLAKIYEFIPAVLRKKIIEPAINNLPTSFSNISLDFKLKKFTSGFEGNQDYRNERWLGAFSHKDKSKLFLKNIWQKVKKENEYEDVDRYIKGSNFKDYYDELALLNQRLYMMDQVLVKVDRASMLNSLEVRAPFLDTAIVDLANHLPSDMKLHGLERKYILKELMKDKLPRDIVYRNKKGFGMPIAEWLRGDLKKDILALLNKEIISKMDLFNYDYIENLLAEHFSGKRDNRKQIWTLFVFSMWWQRWMK